MDDGSAATGQMMPDMQANHGGYNYNNWYQVCIFKQVPNKGLGSFGKIAFMRQCCVHNY